MKIVLQIFSSILNAYLLLCIIGIITTWMPRLRQSKAMLVIDRITGPYLNLWKKIKFLRVGAIDFSPILAISALFFLSNLLELAVYKSITFGSVASLIIQIIWSPIAFILSFFIILFALRIIAYFAKWNSLHPIWRIIDTILNPVVFNVKRLIYRNKIVAYIQGLIISVALLLAIRVLLELVIRQLITLLSRLSGGL